MKTFPSVALVNACLPRQPKEARGAPQGVLYVATALASEGIPASLHDTAIDLNSGDFTPEALGEYLCVIPADIIGISVWDSVLPKVAIATRILKERYPDRMVVLGGPAASCLSGALVRQFPWVDCAVQGDGETNFLNLLKWIDAPGKNPAELSNRVTIRHGDAVVSGRSKVAPVNVGDILIPDYRLIKQSPYTRLEIVSTRGCPFDCPFCSVNRTGGHTLKKRSLDDLFVEISYLLQRGCSDCVHILDDNFGTDRRRLDAFRKRFPAEHPNAYWSCYFRMADLDGGTVNQLADASCLGVYVGVESGSDKLLGALRKGVSVQAVLDRIGYASQRLNVTASFIWGFPGEDVSSIRDTLDLIARILAFDNVYVNLYQLSPLSGTAVYEQIAPSMEFHPEAVSGFIYPPFMAELTHDEKALISEHPSIFSAFYHEGGDDFWQKRKMIKDFIGS